MNIKYTKGGQIYELKNVEGVWLELDNHNEVAIYEVESGVLHVANETNLHLNPEPELGLLIEPQNYSTIHIIPEG